MKFLQRLPVLLVVALSYQAQARKLLVGSYSGQLTTLNFDTSAGTLTQTSTNYNVQSPSWQTLFTSAAGKKFILSTSEVYDGRNDAITVLNVDSNGALTVNSKSTQSTVPMGPVAIAATKDGLLVSAS